MKALREVTKKEDIDYKFRDDLTEKLTPIEILSGPFEGVIYEYGTMDLDESDKKGDQTGPLKFQFSIQNPGKLELMYLKGNVKFVREIGEILYSILVADIDYLVHNPPRLEITEKE